MSRVLAAGADAGRSCPYCRFPIKEGAPAERCDACGSLHHEDCWSDGGGCAVLGCTNAGTIVNAEANPPGQSPQLPLSTSAAPMQTPPQRGFGGSGPGDAWPEPNRGAPRLSSRAILAIAAVIAFLGIGTGVVVATGTLSTHGSSAPPAQPKPGAPAPSSAPAPAEIASDRQTIVQVLGDYQRAYSEHDLQGLSRIFSPGILRHGLAAGGCVVSRGQNAVLADYESQFAQGSGTYRLVGLSAGQIQLDGPSRAHLHANYEITPGGTGFVNFRFATIDGTWKINEVYATCD